MSTVNKPYTFSPSTTASSSEVNDNFDTIYNEFNGNISAANLASNAVTTAKITDSNVTTAKIADSNVTTAKIASLAVTSEKLSPTIGFYATSTQSIPDNTTVAITTYTEVVDYGSDFDPTTGVFTVPVSGFYHFDLSLGLLNLATSVDGRWESFIEVDDGGGYSNVAHGFSDGDGTNADLNANVSISLPLEAGDLVRAKVSSFAGGTEALTLSFFSGYLVGGTA